MNEIVSKCFLAADKFMPEMHLKELGITYSACWPFRSCGLKTKKQKNLKEQEIQDIFIKVQSKYDKACFQYDMACGGFKDLSRRTTW